LAIVPHRFLHDGCTEFDGSLACKKEGGKLSITRKDILRINRDGWDIVVPQFYGGTALPRYGPLAVTEDDVQLYSVPCAQLLTATLIVKASKPYYK
jgi:hypothetical protein